MSKPDWVMRVPVISTSHLPGPHALAKDDSFFGAVVEYDCGWFVYMFEEAEPNEPAYIGDLRRWLKAEFPGEWWIRFDADADLTPELESFEYVWEAMG